MTKVAAVAVAEAVLRPSRRMRGIALIALGMLPVAAILADASISDDYFVVDRLIGHPNAFGMVASVLATGAVMSLVRAQRLATLLVIVFVVAAAACGLRAASSVLFGSLTEREPSVQAPHSDYRAVVYDVGIIDPESWLGIEQTSGLTSRRFEIGCVRGDARVRWDGPGRLLVRAEHVSIDIAVDTRTGRPERPAPLRC